MREGVLDSSTDLRLSGVGSGRALRHRPALRLLVVDAADLALRLQPGLVRLRAKGCVGPYIRGDVLRVDQPFAEPRPVMRRRVGDEALADDPVAAVDADMALVAEDWDGDVHLRGAVFRRLRLGKFNRPTRIRVLLACFGGFVGPDIVDLLARLDPGLLRLGVALARGGDQGRVDNLPTYRQVAGLRDRSVEPREERIQRLGRDQRLAEIPQRIRIGNRIAGAEAAEPHPGQPVGDQVLGLR